MALTVHLVGTGHHYQFGPGVKFGPHECSLEHAQTFSAYLLHLAATSGARLIAEELSLQALEESGASVSVPQQVAAHLRIAHLFCDPNREERAGLDILDENTIRAGASMERSSEEVIQERLRGHCRRREQEWHRRLTEAALSPVLFICGANHTGTFQDLLQASGVVVTVEHRDWEAPVSTER